MSHQVCNVPKEGHFCAEVRALLCSGKSTFVPPRSTMVHKSDTTRKSEAQISIFQRYESQTSLLYLGNKIFFALQAKIPQNSTGKRFEE